VSLTWHPQSYSIIIGQTGPHESLEVHGLVDNLGLFGMHFVDKLHSYVSITPGSCNRRAFRGGNSAYRFLSPEENAGERSAGDF
jgi:hypothetical protein